MTFDEYVTIMKGKEPIHPLVKIELLRKEDESVYATFIRKPLPGSTLTVTNSSNYRRSVSLVLDNSDGAFIPNPNGGLWIDTKFELYVGIENSIGDTIFFPQGVFCLSLSTVEEISESSGNRIVNLRADDKFVLLNNAIGKFYQIAKGDSITNAINSILQQLMNDPKPPLIQSLPYDNVAYPMRWANTDTYEKIVKDLADLYSYDVYYNSVGNLVMENFIDISTLQSQWDFTTGEITYMGATRQQNYGDVYNDVLVTSSQSDNLMFQGEATNTNPTSLTSTTRAPLHTKTIQNDKLPSNDACLQLAKSTLQKYQRIQESISIKCLCLPHFNVNRAVTVTDPTLKLNQCRYAISEISMPLDFSSEMTITAYLYNDTDEFRDVSESGNTVTSPIY